MDKNASEFTVLRTYKSIWKYERKIYSLENIKLLVPVRPSEVLFFGVGLLITYFLCKMVLFLHSVPFIFRYVLIPFGIMKFLTKKRLDGKMPHRFLIGYFSYLAMPKEIARFQPAKKPKAIAFTPVIFRQQTIVNITEQALSGKENSHGKRKKLVRVSG